MIAPIVLSAALASLVAAPPVASILPAGAIQVVAAPDHLVLGDGTSAWLTLRVYDASGAPEDQLPPTLVASVGEVGPVRRSAPGVFKARFTPPAAGSPRVAIILARVRTRAGLIAGWSRIALWGRGRVTVRTKPASQVLLRIGDSAFGPVESDAQGRASVPIEVPPGPRRGIAETVDRAGNTSKKTIDLGIRPFDRLAAFALDENVVADGSEQSGLLAFAVDGRGAPLVDAPLHSTAQHGAIAATLPLAPGVYRLAYRAPSTVGEGSDVVTVELRHDRVSRVRVPVALTPGAPTSIQLSVTPERYHAGSRVRPVLTVRALDGAGNPAPPSLIDVTTEGGVLGVAIPDAAGGVQIPIEIDDNFGRRSVLTIHAQSLRGDAVAEAAVSLEPAACSRIDVAGPSRLFCDGHGEDYTVRCFDRFGNTARIGVPRITGTPLIVESVESEARGALRVRVRTPVLDKAAVTALSVETNDSSGVLQVQLIPSVHLQAVMGPRVIAGWTYGPTWLAGGALDWHLAIPLGHDQLLVGATAAALTSPPFAAASTSAVTVRRLQLFPLLAEVGYQRLFFHRLVGRAGLGIGPVLGAPTVDLEGRTLDQELAVALAAEASLGLGVRLGRGVLEASLRAGYGLPIHEPTAVGQLGGLWSSLGYRLPL